MLRRAVACAAGCVALLSSFRALAQQPWLEDRRYGEGIGLRFGDFEFHPGGAVELGYDSNYFQQSGDSEPVTDVFRLRPTLHASLSTLGEKRRLVGGVGAPPAANFRAGVRVAYNALFPVGSDTPPPVSDHNHLEGGLGFKLDVLPERPVGFDGYGDYVRSVEPLNSPVVEQAFDRGTIQIGAGLNWRPGGGLFEWRLGWELRYHYFERRPYTQLNNTEQMIQTRGRWRWLPRTAFLYDAEYGFVAYSQGVDQNDGQRVQARLGTNGLITTRFALLALAGWAQSYYTGRFDNVPRNYDDFVAHVEFKYFVLPQPTLEPTAAAIGLSSIAAGYVRNFQNSYFGDFYRRDRGYVDFEYFLGGTTLLSLEAGIARLSYPELILRNTRVESAFAETRIDVELFGEYRFSDRFGVNSTLRYDANVTDTSVTVLAPGGGQTEDELKFSRFQVWLGARWFW